jgi:hypothetical protein
LSDRTEIRITEAYRDYEPRFNVKRLVRKLLSTVPGKYLDGLDCVVLTNQASLSRQDRVGKVWSRRRKRSKNLVLGRYHPKFGSTPPYIELRVDKISAGLRGASVHIPILRAVVFGQVLFHEIGHHIHRAIEPQHREKEDVADRWAGKLNGIAVRQNYWYAMPLIVPALKIYKFMRRKQWI